MIAVLDANVLYPQHICDLYLSLADARLFRPIWSDFIHEEWMRNVMASMSQLDPIRIERRRAMMDDTFPNASVSGFEETIDSIQGVHRTDRHVMAAAIAAGADDIVTFNLKDFSKSAQQRYGIRAIHPDEFLVDLFLNKSETVVDVIRTLRSKLVRPSFSSIALLTIYHRAGLSQFANALAPFADQL